MTGTIINSLSILVAGFLGCTIKKSLPENLEKTIMQMSSITIILIGLLGFLSTALTIDGGKLKSQGELMVLISLCVGAAIGETLHIEDKIMGFGDFIEKKTDIQGFAKGFVTASLLFCVGAMAIVGSIQDGVAGDSSILIIKSFLDGIGAFVLAAALGKGVIFSAIPIFLYQGSISILAGVLTNVISPEIISSLCTVGYVLVLCLGTNLLGITKIKTANMLPSLLVAIVWGIASSNL